MNRFDLEPAQLEDVYRALEELQVEIVDAETTGGEKEPVRIEEEMREVSTDALQLFLLLSLL